MREERTRWMDDARRRRRMRFDVPPATGGRTREEELAAFVARGRELAARAGLDFDADAWEVSRSLKPRRGRPEMASRFTLRFTDAPAGVHGEGRQCSRSAVDVAKSFCAGLLGQTSAGPMAVRCEAMVSLAAQLGPRPVTGCTMADLDGAAAALRARYGTTAAALRVARLQGLAASMERAGIGQPGLADWRAKRTDPDAPDRGGGRTRARLPADGLSEAVARAFALAVRPEDVLVAGACTLMQFVPTQLAAMLDMQEECWSGCLEGGARRLLIRLPGDNGSPPCAKWVPREMAEIAELALRRMHEATAEARAIKRWYDRHPDALYLPPRLEHLRKERLTAQEASGLVGLSAEWLLKDAGRSGLEFRMSGRGPATVAFADVERLVLGRLEEMMRLSGGPGRHPLMLIKWHSVRTRMSSECMFQPFARREFSHLLTGSAIRPGMFQRLGIDPSGTLKGTTECWRNQLTEAALRGGLGPDDLRDWFARSDHVGVDRFHHGLGIVRRNVAASPPALPPPARSDGRGPPMPPGGHP